MDKKKEELTEKQKEISKFIRSKNLDVQIKVDGYLPLLNGFDEYAQKELKELKEENRRLRIQLDAAINY